MKDIQTILEASRLRLKFTDDDKKNYKIIADAIGDIVTSISNWSEDGDGREDSNTMMIAHTLDHIAGKLRGEWDDEIYIKDV